MALTDLVLMPGADYQDICDAIREKNGQSGAILSGDAGDLIRAIQGGGGDIPSVFTKFDSGTLTYTSAQQVNNTKITHNLGEAPNFICIYAKNNGALLSANAMVSCIITKLAGSSFFGMTTYYSNIVTTAVVKMGSFQINENNFTVSPGAASIVFKANTTYEWIAAVI